MMAKYIGRDGKVVLPAPSWVEFWGGVPPEDALELIEEFRRELDQVLQEIRAGIPSKEEKTS